MASALSQYNHPPITEAMIEIRVASEITAVMQEKIAKQLKREYPHKQVLNTLDLRLEQKPTGGDLTVSNQPQGLRLTSDDQSKIVVVLQEKLVVACLAPYPGWHALQTQLMTAWTLWRRIAGHRDPCRVGIRFINRIDIPLDGADKIELEDYLNFYPKMPDSSQSLMTHYLMQITQLTDDPLWSANITSTNMPSPLINHMSLLLDIDVFRTEQIPTHDDDFLDMLAKAHIIKNDVFQRCITKQTEALFI